MSDTISLARRVTQVDVSPQFDNYSKVVIHVSDDTTYVAGNDTGRTLEIYNPFGTQAMAGNILSSLRGYQYQPYVAQGALLDPAAEIGDAVNMRGAYGGIYTRERTFGRLMKADVSAPHDEEINHEYKFETPQERQFKRQIDDVKASLIIANDRISAEVTARQNGDAQLQSSITQTASAITASVVARNGGSTSSFGWSLLSNAHRWYANGQEVMSVTASGLTVKGNVQATSGTIGGFTIGASALYNNMPSMSATQSSGVYIGTDGIKLGQSFRVDSTGQVNASNIAANNMVLTGVLTIGGQQITADALRSGAQSAYSTGSYWSGGSGYGYSYNNATKESGGTYPNFFRANGIVAARSFSCYGSTMLLGSYSAKWMSKTIAGVTIRYLGRD